MNSTPSTESGCLDLSSKRILVANDFSAASVDALVASLRIAKRCGAELVVLNVEETPHRTSRQAPAPDLLVEQEIHHQRTRQRINALVNQDLAPAASRNLPAIKALAVDGDPATEIVMTAFDIRADLIVIASHGCDHLENPLLGKTAEKVVKYASCPVLVVRQTKNELNLPPVHLAAEMPAKLSSGS